MIVTCPNCTTKYNLADEKIASEGIKVRCSKCSHQFQVMLPETEAAEEMEVSLQNASSEAPVSEVEKDFEQAQGFAHAAEDRGIDSEDEEFEDDYEDDYENGNEDEIGDALNQAPEEPSVSFDEEQDIDFEQAFQEAMAENAEAEEQENLSEDAADPEDEHLDDVLGDLEFGLSEPSSRNEDSEDAEEDDKDQVWDGEELSESNDLDDPENFNDIEDAEDIEDVEDVEDVEEQNLDDFEEAEEQEAPEAHLEDQTVEKSSDEKSLDKESLNAEQLDESKKEEDLEKDEILGEEEDLEDDDELAEDEELEDEDLEPEEFSLDLEDDEQEREGHSDPEVFYINDTTDFESQDPRETRGKYGIVLGILLFIFSVMVAGTISFHFDLWTLPESMQDIAVEVPFELPLKVPFLVSAGASQNADPTERIKEIQPVDFRQYVVKNVSEGHIFVVEGKARNNSKTPKKQIKVAVSLFAKDGTLLAQQEQLCGNTLSLFQLQVDDRQSMEQNLASPRGTKLNNSYIESGETTPFMFAFFGLQAKVEEYNIRIADALEP